MKEQCDCMEPVLLICQNAGCCVGTYAEIKLGIPLEKI